mmetsp:Transcript_23490/g.50264  ORF Transcript_23490/g.50264 Transcript_23490/m.50264 type:complete len:667 (-) Transcript_23490:140-2140(-)
MQLGISLVLRVQQGDALKNTKEIHSYQEYCRGPVVMSSFGAGGKGSYSRHDSLSTPPRSDRRVIFPSLHRASPPPHKESKPGQDEKHQGRDRRSTIDISPTNVDTNIQAVLFKPLLRANSLDGIPIPLPKLSEESKHSFEEDLLLSRPVNQKFPLPRPSNQTTKTQKDPVHQTNIQPAQLARPGKKWDVQRSRAGSLPVEEKPSKSPIFGEAVRHRTHYPAASVPTHVGDVKCPSCSKPLASILRRRGAVSSRQNLERCDESFDLSTRSLTEEAPNSAALTLASPASIKSLRSKPRQREGEGVDGGIGESEYMLEQLSDTPKIIPRKQGKLPRNQSDTVIGKSDDELSRDSGSCVSRHASLECLPSNKRIAFDPHVIVYEFGVTNYEKKGGEKWFTADELDQFKKEAMQRIRLRSAKTLIPTGTGRALAVAQKEKANLDEKSKGAVSFNHPALSCEDDFDSESGSQRKSSIRESLQDRTSAAAAHIKNILIVDSHEIFLALFTKSLKHMVPHASVATARSSEEAMTRIEAARKAFPLSDGGAAHGFDIIIVEERLRVSSPLSNETQNVVSTQTAGDDSVQRRSKVTSGSALIRHLVELGHKFGNNEDGGESIRHSLLIGVSARLAQDHEKIEKSGADCIWGKPPPDMNSTLRNELIKLLMKKRTSK